MLQFSASSCGAGCVCREGEEGGGGAMIPTAGLERVLPAVPGSQVTALLSCAPRHHPLFHLSSFPSDASF